MKCKNCGAELNNGDLFCMNCGNSVDYSQNNKKTGVIIAVCVVAVVAIIAAVLIVGMLMNKNKPDADSDAPVFQQETSSESETTSSAEQTTFNIVSDIKLPTYKAGDVIIHGSYEQDGNLNNGKEPVEWTVFYVEELDNEYRYHLVSKVAIDSKPYNNIAGNVNWKTSSIRKWLNDDFMKSAFSEKEQQSMCLVDADYVRLLSKNEVNKAVADGWDSKASASVYAQKNGAYTEGGYCGYWLMDSGDSSRVAARVNIHGKVLTSYSESEGGVERTDYAVRPVITIIDNPYG